MQRLTWLRLVAALGVPAALLAAPASRADIDGVPAIVPTACASSIYSDADAICSLLSEFASADVCQTTANTCAQQSQEIFVGNQIEALKPGSSKSWTGFGGLGLLYQLANVCLLRDIAQAPITSFASASSTLGTASIEQRVQFLSFDRTTFEWQGYHTGRACAPVVGCLDVFEQRIAVRPVGSSLVGQGKQAGGFKMYTAQGLDVTTDSIDQAFEATIPAIQVRTPYGTVSAEPSFSLSRANGFVLSPYQNGNFLSEYLGAKLVDVYGRNPGTGVGQIFPVYFVFGATTLDFRRIGWSSQIAFGSRDADPDSAPWTPPPANLFPPRPDFDLSQARSDLEKTPNAHLGASVEVAYSPTDLLPQVIRDNDFITVNFKVYATPTIENDYASQFDSWNYEIASADHFLGVGSLLDYRPMFMDQQKLAGFAAGSSVATSFELVSGVDLTLHLHVPLLFGDLDIDLIDIHPSTTIPLSGGEASAFGSGSALAATERDQIVPTGKLFQTYQTVLGPRDGVDHLWECLAAPSELGEPPPPPGYDPGDPTDLTENIQYPCNICIGTNGTSWVDEDGATHTIDPFLQTITPVDQGNKPEPVRWSCSLVAEAGCYDMCDFDPVADVLTVAKTAVELMAAGEAENMPPRCD